MAFDDDCRNTFRHLDPTDYGLYLVRGTHPLEKQAEADFFKEVEVLEAQILNKYEIPYKKKTLRIQFRKWYIEQGASLAKADPLLKDWLERRDRFLQPHLKHVISLSSGRFELSKTFHITDYISDGSFGLLESYHYFDYRRGAFSTISRRSILQTQTRAIAKEVNYHENLQGFRLRMPSQSRSRNETEADWLYQTAINYLQETIESRGSQLFIRNNGLFGTPQATIHELAAEEGRSYESIRREIQMTREKIAEHLMTESLKVSDPQP